MVKDPDKSLTAGDSPGVRALRRPSGTVLVVVVFVIALLSGLVMAVLQVNAEEIQLMQNHVYAAQAQAVAEAGLNDALAHLRDDAGWDAGFANKAFDGGSYTVTVDGSTVAATGTTAMGFVARVTADLTISTEGPPHAIRIDRLGINP